jgi:PleD family two-component response regulator
MNKLAENPATVLIVNDDQMQLDLLRDLLEPEGYKVFVAQNGLRALEITRTIRIEIIISDEWNGIMPAPQKGLAHRWDSVVAR